MRSVLIPLAEGFEEIEAVCVIDVLRRAGVEVVTAGLRPGPVTASRRVVVVPDMTLDQAMARDFDMLVLPGGGPGVENLRADPRIRQLLERYLQPDRSVGAICAAPTILAAYGHLAGRQATSYPSARGPVAAAAAAYREDAVVVDCNLVTSRGPGTAIAFGLALVEMLAGRGRRDEVAAGLVLAGGGAGA